MGMEPAGRGFSLGDLLQLYAVCPQGRHRTQEAFDSFVLAAAEGDPPVAIVRLPEGTYLGVDATGRIVAQAGLLTELMSSASAVPGWRRHLAGWIASAATAIPGGELELVAVPSTDAAEPGTGATELQVPPPASQLTESDLRRLGEIWPQGQRRRGRGKDSFIVEDADAGRTRLIVSRRRDGSYSCVDLVAGTAERADSLAGLRLRRPTWQR